MPDPVPDTAAVLRLAAFTDRSDGGNPAGVVLDAAGMDGARMQALAAAVGYSETAFLADRLDGTIDVRYFSPEAEVPFCGHATIAAAVAAAGRRGPGDLLLHTRAGDVRVHTAATAGTMTATLTSVEPAVLELGDGDLDRALTALRWPRGDLDPDLPPRIAYAGARHLVLAAATRERRATWTMTSTVEGLHGRARPDHRGPRLAAGRHHLPRAQPVSRRRRRRGPGDRRRRSGARRLPARAAGRRAAGARDHPPGRGRRTPSLLVVDVPVAGGIDVTGGAVVIGDAA